MRVRLGKQWFTLRESGNLGDCGQCEITRGRDGTVKRVIRVATWQHEEDALDTWVHEAMHAIWPDKPEAEVASANGKPKPHGTRLRAHRRETGTSRRARGAPRPASSKSAPCRE